MRWSFLPISLYTGDVKADNKIKDAKPDATKTNQDVGAILEKKLQRRPSKTEVMDKNILKKGGTYLNQKKSPNFTLWWFKLKQILRIICERYSVGTHGRSGEKAADSLSPR